MISTPLAFVPADGALDVAITIAVAVIAIIGWIVKLVGQFKPAQPPRPPMNRPQPAAGRPVPVPAGRPRDERLQSEIDAFLREVATGRKAPQPTEIEEDAIEVIEDDDPTPVRRVASAAPAGQGGPPTSPVPTLTGQPSDWDREQQQRRERLLSTLSQRHLEATPLGADLRKHVEGYMNESLQLRKEKEQVERRLAETRAELHAMRARVAAGGGAAPVAGGPTGSSRFAALLKNRRSVKDAIVINEVLGRPKALTRGR